MKASSLCLALGVAQLAACAPTPNARTRADEVLGTRHGGIATTAPRVWSINLIHDSPAAPRQKGFVPNPPLSKHRTPSEAGRPQPDHPEQQRDHEAAEPLDADRVVPPHLSMPCHQGRSSRERNDMLVVFLAVAFMAVVVVMETWGSIFKRQGAIRLEETPSQPPVSIRAAPDNQSGIGDEKRSV